MIIELCVSHEHNVKVTLFTKTYPICCTVSNVFLVMTFMVYALLPDLRAPLFGKITMIFVFCLFMAYFSISIVSFGHWKLVNDRPIGKQSVNSNHSLVRDINFSSFFLIF